MRGRLPRRFGARGSGAWGGGQKPEGGAELAEGVLRQGQRQSKQRRKDSRWWSGERGWSLDPPVNLDLLGILNLGWAVRPRVHGRSTPVFSLGGLKISRATESSRASAAVGDVGGKVEDAAGGARRWCAGLWRLR